MVHPAVVILGGVGGEPEQRRAPLRRGGEAEAGEHRPAAGLHRGQVEEEGGEPGAARPLVVLAPVVHVDLYLAAEAVVDHVILVRGRRLLVHHPARGQRDSEKDRLQLKCYFDRNNILEAPLRGLPGAAELVLRDVQPLARPLGGEVLRLARRLVRGGLQPTSGPGTENILYSNQIFSCRQIFSFYLASTASHSPGDMKSLNMATWGPGPPLRGSYLDACKIFILLN